MKNKKLIIIISSIILLIIIGIICIFLLTKKKEAVPYVEEKEIKVLSAKEKYSVPVAPYSKDAEGNVIDVDGVTFDDSKATYTYTDYMTSEPDEDGYQIYSFKFYVDVPISFTSDTKKDLPYYKYTFMFIQPAVFDYYTGEVCKEKNESVTGTVNYNDIEDPEAKEFKYTDITWNDKTYKIGVRMESSSDWDNLEKSDEGDGVYSFRNTNHIITTVYIHAPKDYDGLMLSLKKKGSTKQDLLSQLEYNKRYYELVDESNQTGEKSEELIQMEDNNKRVFKLLEARNTMTQDFDKDDFYVVRVNDIEKNGI